MTRPAFIDDLIPLILDAQHHWWPRDLVNLALLSTSWLYYVRTRMYSHPRLHSFRNVHRLARTLQGQPGLRKYVEGLSVLPVGQRTRTWRSDLKCVLAVTAHEDELQDEGRDPRRRLRCLVLGGELAINAEQYLRLILHPDQVEDLHIDGSAYRDGLGQRAASIEWDEGLTCLFSGLQRLRFSELELDVVAGSGTTPLSAKRLVLENVGMVGGTVAELLNGSAVLEGLHVSTKDGLVFDEQIAQVLQACAVECLHYGLTKAKRVGEPFVLDVESPHVSSVRCVHLEDVALDAGCVGMIGTRYTRVEELVIGGRYSGVSCREWVELLSGGFCKLRRLVLPFSRWPVEEREGIAGFALSQGISLESTCDK